MDTSQRNDFVGVHAMRIRRTLPPAAIPFRWEDILNGLKGRCRGEQEIERFRREICRHYGVRHCFLVSSGKAALVLILRALRELRPHCDTVLIPAFTCYSVPSAIVRAGLRVALCDIDEETLDFDDDQLKSILNGSDLVSNPVAPGAAPGKAARTAVTEDRLLAVLPTHLFGIAADIGKIRRLLAGRPIPIVEDAAQAFGARTGGRLLGGSGDVGFFSLGRGKAFSTVEGGVILTDRPDIADRLERLVADLPDPGFPGEARLAAYSAALKAFLHPSRFWLPQGMPFLHLGETVYDPDFPVQSFTGFQAGLSRGWQARSRLLRQTRIGQVRAWRQDLAKLKGTSIRPLGGTTDEENLIRLPLRVSRECRRRILEDPEAPRLGVMPAYPGSIDEISGIVGQAFPDVCVRARRIARELVTLPLHAFVRSKDRRNTINLLASASAASERHHCQ